MAKVTMPQLGESVAEGTIGKWLKKPGDHVAKYEPLLEVITDKVNAEVPSPFEGVLKEILVEEGATVPNNAEIAVIEEAGAAAECLDERLGRSRREGRCAKCGIETSRSAARRGPCARTLHGGESRVDERRGRRRRWPASAPAHGRARPQQRLPTGPRAPTSVPPRTCQAARMPG